MFWDKDKDKDKKSISNTPEEDSFLTEINNHQSDAETGKVDVEKRWNDEYLAFIGKQWDLSFARRKADSKAVRPNSVDNFIFPAIMGMHSSLTVTMPEVTMEIDDGDDETDDTELERKVTDNVANIFEKNKFPALWKKIVLRGIMHGPFIAAVLWDNDWIGGNGPNRWVGEVRVIAQKMEEIYFDPAILDLEERLQECSFIHRKIRKKLSWFKDKWEKGFVVCVDDGGDDEGADPQQAWLYEAWHKGKPKFMPPDRKKELQNKAQSYLPPAAVVDEYKAELYQQMAEGKVNGVHVSYSSKEVFLEYVPYAYEDGEYPFVFKTLYLDEKSPYGFGEILNTMVPQVMHNKADEIEIEAMSVEGLGGYFYQTGALSPKQLAFLQQNNYKGGLFAEVDGLALMKAREGAKTPANIAAYKEHKQRMVETISKNTPIRQGMAPTGNMPYAAIAELGARTDTSAQGISETLEDFMKELVLMIVSRMKEFYTEERAYKIRNSVEKMTGQTKYGRFSNKDLMKSWVRQPAVVDPATQSIIEPEKAETYMPDFTAKVKIMDERPTDRNYYIAMAIQMVQLNMIDPESFWYVIEEGKFPPKEVVMERLQNLQATQAGMEQPAPGEEQPGQPDQIQQFIDSLPEDVAAKLDQLPQEQLIPEIEKMMAMPPEELQAYIQQDGRLDEFLASLTPEEAQALQNDEALQNEAAQALV